MGYQPISNHGLIGNMRTAALVDTTATIDWFCLPRFDSPSVFGALLDAKKGGRFQIAPAQCDTFSRSQMYLPDTNVLMTKFQSPDGAADVIDFMPMQKGERRDECLLVRLVKGRRGSVRVLMECQPAFDYGRERHHIQASSQSAILCASSLALAVSSSTPLQQSGEKIIADFTLNEGQSAAFSLAIRSGSEAAQPISEEQADELLGDTVDYWRLWIGKSSYRGRWREMVSRSALALELLVYEPTGAVVAAPTTSLPESIGGERNWDYRCSWIRDSAFTVYALLRIGLTDEADRFMGWLESLCHGFRSGKGLNTVYAVDGSTIPTEEKLSHWEGYRNSSPVRIGNNAVQQLQMDIYGELMDAVYLYNKYRGPISSELWLDLRPIVDWVCENWRQQDNGIWEIRGGRRDFVYSKLMCWVALDRGIRMALQRSFPADLNRWMKTRNEIYEDLLIKGWSERRRAFVQSYGGEVLDASILMMPLVFYMSPADPKMLSTIEAICRPPSQGGLVSDGKVFRYNTWETKDGLQGGEGTFNMCTFWLVEAMTRAARIEPARLHQARDLFALMMAQSNHLGLYSEETGPSGEFLGNFPQAFAHLASISSAVNLDRVLSADVGFLPYRGSVL